MVTLEIRLLTGRYAAASLVDPSVPEWPPNPARIFSALTAALYDGGATRPEREAIEWLARAGAPEIVASEASVRRLGDVYVPTNDPKALPDIDRHIRALEEAEAKLGAAEGTARKRAQAAATKAYEKLVQQSQKSAAADGKGTPLNAARVLDRRLGPHPRKFPVAVPHDAVVHVKWKEDPSASIAAELDAVAARVARLGHTSSLVSMRVVEGDVETMNRIRWLPDENGDVFLRVPLPGQLALLDDAHERYRQVEQRILPCESVRYREVRVDRQPAMPPAESVFSSGDAWLLFEVVASNPRERRLLLDASLAQDVARAMRGTLLREIRPDGPESLTGHTAVGKPSQRAHLAFLPLSDVGHRHASGSILGVALVPPQDLSTSDRDALLDAVFRAETAAQTAEATVPGTLPPPLSLWLGRRGVLLVRRLREPAVLRTLQPERWTGPSRRWASVTAVALGRNPGNLRARDPDVLRRAMDAAEATVVRDCIDVGLPAPAAVWIHYRSVVTGAPAARRFMPFPSEGSGPKRVCVHAELLFDAPVQGPVVLGAGRYFGLGLCAPIRT